MFEFNELDFNTLGGGALNEMFKEEITKVLRNIDDPVAKKKTKRQIIIKIGFEPNADGSSCELEFDIESKLAKTTPTIKSTAFIGMDASNNPVIKEWGRGQLPGQLSHTDYIEPEVSEETQKQPVTSMNGFK